MPDCDPLTQRINDSIIAERDRLRKENEQLRRDLVTSYNCARKLLEFNRRLSDDLNTARNAYDRLYEELDDATEELGRLQGIC